jgi:hypothetical protein
MGPGCLAQLFDQVKFLFEMEPDAVIIAFDFSYDWEHSQVHATVVLSGLAD